MSTDFIVWRESVRSIRPETGLTLSLSTLTLNFFTINRHQTDGNHNLSGFIFKTKVMTQFVIPHDGILHTPFATHRYVSYHGQKSTSGTPFGVDFILQTKCTLEGVSGRYKPSSKSDDGLHTRHLFCTNYIVKKVYNIKWTQLKEKRDWRVYKFIKTLILIKVRVRPQSFGKNIPCLSFIKTVTPVHQRTLMRWEGDIMST